MSRCVRASRRTSGGTSRLRGRAWLFVASEELVLVTMILSLIDSRGVRRGNGGGDVRASTHMRGSHSARSPLSPPAIVGYEWVRDDVLKYNFSLTSTVSVIALWCQVKLASPEESCKIVVQAFGSDDFPSWGQHWVVHASYLCIGACLRSWGLFYHSLSSNVIYLSTWMWLFLNSTQIVRQWWELLKFYAPSLTSDPMCQSSCISSRWIWWKRLVGSPWTICPTSCSSLTWTSLVVDGWWFATYAQQKWEALLLVLLEDWSHQV